MFLLSSKPSTAPTVFGIKSRCPKTAYRALCGLASADLSGLSPLSTPLEPHRSPHCCSNMTSSIGSQGHCTCRSLHLKLFPSLSNWPTPQHPPPQVGTWGPCLAYQLGSLGLLPLPPAKIHAKRKEK